MAAVTAGAGESAAGSSGGGKGGKGVGRGGDLPTLIPLRVHSDYSLQAGALPGCAQVKRLVASAKARGLPALALTDHGVMHGAVELLQLCRREGIKPIIGMDMYVYSLPGGAAGPPRMHQLTVLAKDTVGYSNLASLCTASHLAPLDSKGFPVIRPEDLAAKREGLVVMSGGFAWEWGVGGEIPAAIIEGRPEDARRCAEWCRDTFGGDFYLQLEDHGFKGGAGGEGRGAADGAANSEEGGGSAALAALAGGSKDDGAVNIALVALAGELGIRCVVGSNVHMVEAEDVVALDALSCIHGGRKMERRAVCTGMEYLRPSGDLMAHMRRYLSEEQFRDAVDATHEVASQVQEYDILSEPRIPDFPGIPEGQDADSFLQALAAEGLEARLATLQLEGAAAGPYYERLEVELGVLARCGFSSYFLLVWDLLKYARDQGIPVGPGRGSAAGSLVAWALQLTALDPVRHGLLFERFLNEERKSMPDIDTDLCIEGRDKVIAYVAERYGDDRVAQIGTFGRMTSRAVLKDVARVQGRSYTFSDLLAKLVPVVRGKPTPLATMVGEDTPAPEFRARYLEDDDVRETVDLALKLEGIHRNVGVHAAGVVIAPAVGGLQHVPLLRNDEGSVVTQFAMEEVEALGLLKMDLLGLRNLTCIARAYDLIKEHHGVELPAMECLPEDDAKTYCLLGAGGLEGIFQLDTSAGMLAVVRGMQPSNLEDIFALLALYRPGPLDAGLIPLYIDRKHGRAKVEYQHPLLEPILQPTYGVLLYQEQIMRVAQDLAGYSLGEADLLRRAMGKKKKEEMEAQRAKFTTGAEARGVPPAVAVDLFEQMVNFAEYCFNKSHSAAYGLITYTTAYLKANYPVAFMAALLSVNKGSPDKLQKYMAAAARMGIRLLPPCVNSSGRDFTVASAEEAAREGAGGRDAGMDGECIGAIRFGLEAIRHVGAGAVGQILDAREAGGPFTSLPELFSRAGEGGKLNSRALQSLAGCGALDALHPTGDTRPEAAAMLGNRRALLAEVKPVMSWAAGRQAERSSGQSNLFDMLGPGSDVAAVYGSEHSDPAVAYSAQRAARGGEGGGEEGGGDDAEDMEEEEMLRKEKDLLGFYVSRHPLEGPLTRLPAWLGAHPVSELGALHGGEVVGVAGLLTGLKGITTKKGDMMARIMLEDPTGRVDGVIFPSAFAGAKGCLVQEAKLLLWGTLQVREEGEGDGKMGGGGGRSTELIVSSVVPLDEAQGVAIHLSSEEAGAPGARQRLKGALVSAAALGRAPATGRRRPDVGPCPVSVVVHAGAGGGPPRVVRLGPAFNVTDVPGALEVLRQQGLSQVEAVPLLGWEEALSGRGALPPAWAPLPRAHEALLPREDPAGGASAEAGLAAQRQGSGPAGAPGGRRAAGPMVVESPPGSAGVSVPMPQLSPAGGGGRASSPPPARQVAVARAEPEEAPTPARGGGGGKRSSRSGIGAQYGFQHADNSAPSKRWGGSGTAPGVRRADDGEHHTLVQKWREKKYGANRMSPLAKGRSEGRQ